MPERESELQPRTSDPAELQAALAYIDANINEAPIIIAAMARDKGAFSYRDFLVGCVVLTIKKGENFIDCDFAGNYKAGEGPKTPDDKCAEIKALEKALERDPRFIVEINTVSKETHTGNPNEQGNHDVLHPCRICRDRFRSLIAQGLMSPNTRLRSVKDNGKFWKDQEKPIGYEGMVDFARNYTYEKKETMTIGELLEKYKTDLE